MSGGSRANSAPVNVLSYGGGTQTLAMGRMVLSGDLERPDLVAFADTQREREATYAAVRREFGLLEAAGIPTVIVTGGDLAERGLRGELPLTPLYTINLVTGKEGRMNSICSERFKTRIVRRELRRRGLRTASIWLGLSTDEIGRVKPSKVKCWVNRWPLIEKDLRRADCESYLERIGAPKPVKSACIMCPHRRVRSFLRMTEEERDFAIQYDEAIRHSRPGFVCFVSDQRRPLREVLAAASRQISLLELDEEDSECSGTCFT